MNLWLTIANSNKTKSELDNPMYAFLLKTPEDFTLNDF